MGSMSIWVIGRDIFNEGDCSSRGKAFRARGRALRAGYSTCTCDTGASSWTPTGPQPSDRLDDQIGARISSLVTNSIRIKLQILSRRVDGLQTDLRYLRIETHDSLT